MASHGPDFSPVLSSTPRAVPAIVKTGGPVLMVVGLLAAAFGLFAVEGGGTRVAATFVINFLYWAGIARGAMMFAVVFVIVKVAGVVLKRLAEGMALTMVPLYLLLIVFLLSGAEHLRVVPLAGDGRSGRLRLPAPQGGLPDAGLHDRSRHHRPRRPHRAQPALHPDQPPCGPRRREVQGGRARPRLLGQTDRWLEGRQGRDRGRHGRTGAHRARHRHRLRHRLHGGVGRPLDEPRAALVREHVPRLVLHELLRAGSSYLGMFLAAVPGWAPTSCSSRRCTTTSASSPSAYHHVLGLHALRAVPPHLVRQHDRGDRLRVDADRDGALGFPLWSCSSCASPCPGRCCSPAV